ncbi:LLM class F420-dependent oxidoreductase [Saccharopolyspora rosea]|uniref:LLM class F420-dependent oxidoreductase n=1 Tax=Saccharopolyspora rosea TaxID=524884 RepID=UPI0021D95AED|nr:LLM class F420-dependent oxidoreductase [Saccharopolyspora rosea]
MRYGVVLFTSDRGISPAEAARTAEEAGFDSFAVPEHTHIPVRREAAHPGTGTGELPDDRYLRTLDPWVALATAASVTRRITLSTAVALPAEHDPITLAKTIATLDHLSGGRVVVGTGFGWNTDELADHGIPGGRRRTALREYLTAMRALWTQDEASFEGEFVSFGPSWAWPKPVRAGHVPVLLGAGGTERNLAWVARHADGWITTPTERDIAERVRHLRELWTGAGRDGAPEVVALAGKPDPGTLTAWSDAGVTEVLFGLPDAPAEDVIGYIHRLAERVGLTSGAPGSP